MSTKYVLTDWRNSRPGSNGKISHAVAGNWRVLQDDGKDEYGHHLPIMPGCYVVYVDGTLSYVGSCVNLESRLQNRFKRMPTGRWRTEWGVFGSVKLKFRISRIFGDSAMYELRI